MIARTLIVAQKNADDLARAAQARADEIVANAEAIANTVLQSARDEASQILQKTRDEAEAITRSVKQQAAGWLTLLKTESDQMVRSAHMAFREAQRSVEQNVMSFPSELERHVADWVASMPDGGQGAAGSGHVPTIDPRTGDLARSFALVDASAATLGADAVTPPSKSGRS